MAKIQNLRVNTFQVAMIPSTIHAFILKSKILIRKIQTSRRKYTYVQ